MNTPTQITIYLNPADEEHALYLIGESLTATTFTIVGTQEEQVSWGASFVSPTRKSASPWHSLCQ